MNDRQVVAARLGRVESLPVLAAFARNTVSAMRRLHAAKGRYVLLQYPHSRADRPRLLACVADASLYRAIITNPEAWRAVNVSMRAMRGSAASRIVPITRLRGLQHAHYRRLLAPTMSKPAVAGMAAGMTHRARDIIATWPRDRAVDLMPLIHDLVQELAIGLLFGNDRARAIPVARMIDDATAAVKPLPGRAFFRWLRTAPKLERAIHRWADDRKGELDPKDILSVLVNNPDEHGRTADKQVITGILAFTFGAAYETCQNALAWSLVMLTQHPHIAAALTDEIGDDIAAERIVGLASLDGIIKESMRLFPPIPVQSRRSEVATELGGVELPAGTRVFNNVFLINRDEARYSNPNRFDPERWRDLDPSPVEYPVFGAGGRMCPGALFGHQIVQVALATILATHRVELAPNARIDHHTTISLVPSPGVPVILRGKTAMAARRSLCGSIHELVELAAAH